jgi:DNA primase
MERSRGVVWKDYSDVYTVSEIRVILNSIGVRVASETDNDFLCFCPFHGNSNTPSMTVSRVTGVYNCFSPSCGAAGGFRNLVARATGKNHQEARRFMASYRSGGTDYAKILEEIGKDAEPVEIAEWDGALMRERQEDLFKSAEAIEYLKGRGFTRETIEKFGVGYSSMRKSVMVPCHDEKGMLVGVVGRSIYSKRFSNSKHLPRNQIVFNAHRAKRAGGTAIITEATFDAMLLDQRGYHGAVAILGGVLGKHQVQILDRLFDRIIIATDFDNSNEHRPANCPKCKRDGLKECKGHNPGRDLGMKIAQALPGKEILWACTSTTEVYPNGKKDIGDMTVEETRAAINGSIGHFEYLLLDLYYSK